MKKDIEWLVKMINEELDILRQRIESGEGTPNQITFDEGRGWALSHVLRMMYYPDKLEELSKEFPEKVVVPQFVADEFDYNKNPYWEVDESKDVSHILKCAFGNEGKPSEFLDWVRENPEDYVMAVRNGCEVEEEPLYHALVKGHELLTREYAFKYWSYDTFDDVVFTCELPFQKGRYITEMIKESWDKLGINDSNADFVRVDEQKIDI